MKVGTRSVLFGAHCFFLHPFFVAAAWWKLFGFPWDPRLWVLFFVHDLGYLRKPNMDGPEGEDHVWLGAKIMGVFDSQSLNGARWLADIANRLFGEIPSGKLGDTNCSWYCLSFYHSRFMAKRYGVTPSRLCIADKLAFVFEPAWLYIPRVILTGEVKEYMAAAHHQKGSKYGNEGGREISKGVRAWHRSVRDYVARWVQEHKDGRADTWTPSSPPQEVSR